MIDYETTIFNDIHAIAAPLCAKNRFLSTPILSYTNLPAASLVEISNTTVRRRQSSTPVENYARLMYQLDCYALSKAECKQVYGAADEMMIALGFTRISGDFLDNAGDVDLFRYTARYEAEIDPSGNIYRISG